MPSATSGPTHHAAPPDTPGRAAGFRTPLGILAIAGLHGLPMWLYAAQHGVSLGAELGALLIVGRLVSLALELWVVSAHVRRLLRDGGGRA